MSKWSDRVCARLVGIYIHAVSFCFEKKQSFLLFPSLVIIITITIIIIITIITAAAQATNTFVKHISHARLTDVVAFRFHWSH